MLTIRNDNINDNTLKMITCMITQNMNKCYYFSLSAIVIIFMLSFSYVHVCVIIYVIIFRVLSFMLSFDVIIFHGQQMLSFLCYHFLLYIFFVIIYDIIYYYHDIYIMKNDTSSTIKKITSRNSKIITFTQKNDNIPYTWKW